MSTRWTPFVQLAFVVLATSTLSICNGQTAHKIPTVNTDIGAIPPDGQSHTKSIPSQCVQLTSQIPGPPTIQGVGIKAECNEPIFLFVGNSTDEQPDPHSSWVIDHAFQAQMLTITKKSNPPFEAGIFHIRICTSGPPLGKVHIAITSEAGNGIIPGGHGILDVASSNKGDRINVRWEPAQSAAYPDKEPQPFRYCVYAISQPIQSKSKSFFYDLSTWRQIEALGSMTRRTTSVTTHTRPHTIYTRASSLDYEFAVMSDLHVGEGFPVFNVSDENYSTHHLKSAVAGINAYAAQPGSNLQFVIITGDITSSSQPSEYTVALEILSNLTVPFYPLMGNHDVWQYDANGQTPQAHGDQLFAQAFADVFNTPPPSHSGLPVTLVYDNKTVYNPTYNISSHFINYRLEVGDLVFLALDWNTRHKAILGKPGALPNAELYNFTGGTFDWLKGQLELLSKRSNVSQVVLLQHQPFRSFPIPSWYFTFNDDEKKAIRDLLSTYLPVSRYWGILAGHLHRWYDGTSFDEWPTFRQWETDACKGQWDDKNISSAWSLVQVVNNGSVLGNLSRHYGSDCTACPPTLVYPAMQDK